MSVADDHAVMSRDHVLHHAQHAVSDCFARVHEHIGRAVDQLSDDDALALDPQTWAEARAAELAVKVPRVDVDGHEFVNEGRIQVDCTGWPGVPYSTTEYGRGVLRDGHRFRVNVPGEGDLELLRSRLGRGGTGRKADVSRDSITRVYEWPQALAAAELQADVDGFLADLRTGAEEIAREIDERNAQLICLAARALADRQQTIRESRDYLGDLRLTVTRNPEAETIIPALPTPVPQPGRRSPRTATAPQPARGASPSERSAIVVDGPTLDQFYDHVVRVISAVAVGFERSPRRFANAEEETLRDFILVTLNSHYEGAASGETFNATGKTDILVRHGMDNAFIGECKIWSGKAQVDDTFDQLGACQVV